MMILMPGISLLMFSRNDVDDAIKLVRGLYDSVNDIVIVDSSNGKEHARLERMQKSFALRKLRIYYAVALGYPEPLRQYGFNTCKSEWILLIDTDERLSPDLKSRLHALVADKQVHGYYIKRYEYVRPGSSKGFSTWQLRLYRKACTESRGMLHETPSVSGRTIRINDDRMFMDHLGTVQRGNSYNRMYMFSPISLYGRMARDVYISLRARGIIGTILFMKNIVNGSIADKGDRTEEVKGITRILEKVGVTKFLDLDKEVTIRKLNSRYRNKKQGIDLLIKLIFEKYRKQSMDGADISKRVKR